MPLYEYKCTDCGYLFEKIKPVSQAENKETCPRCQKNGAERKLSSFSAGRGTGTTASAPGCGSSGGFS